MAERTTALYRLVTIPVVYRSFQNLLGGVSARDALRDQFFPDVAGKRLLEVGCGPGTWAPHLASARRYLGVDWNADHIAVATAQHGSDNVQFLCGDVAAMALEEDGFDYVFAFGLLHHLGDAQAQSLLASVTRLMAPDGAFISVDPVYHDGQHPFAKWMNDRDSGQDIRRPPAYEALVAPHFGQVDGLLCTDKLRIPYSHYIMTCRHPTTHGAA